ASCDPDARHKETREGWVDQFEIDRLVCDQVHRESEEKMCADRSEPHDHEVPLSDRAGELMSLVEAGHPDAVANGPFAGARGIEATMRLAEIQNKGNFGGWEVTFLNRHAEAARARDVAMNIGA